MAGATPNDTFLALVAIPDMGPLIVDRFGLEPGPLSPLLGFVHDYESGSRPLSSEGAEVEAAGLTGRALSVLAHPELFFITLSGGAGEPVVQEVTCHAPTIEDDAFVSIAPAPDGTLIVQWHRNAWEFLARWLNTLASNASETTPNLIPPPTTAEMLLYTLHIIDAYNRLMMQWQLDHEPAGVRPVLTPEALVESMRTSIESADTRWVLPAFLAMMPGITPEVLGQHPQAFEQLEALDFLRMAQDESGQEVLMFGDAAIIMGEEFMRLWAGAAGFRIALGSGETLVPLGDGFLAATGLANHLVRMTGEEAGETMLNHQALTRDELETQMAMMMADALEKTAQVAGRTRQVRARETVSPAPPNVQPPLPQERPRRCPVCGKPLAPGARFCGHCGAPVPNPEKASETRAPER